MSKRPAMPRPLPVKDVLQGLLTPGDREALAQRQTIRRVWETVVPRALLAQTRLLEVRRKELWVEVAASPLSQELQFLKPRILQALDQSLGPGRITDVRVRLGEF